LGALCKGFFEAGNFHPDFMVWLLTPGFHHIAFVDPKGIRQIGAPDPKVQFYQTIKEIEERMADPNICLDSFIISGTPSHTMRMLWRIDEAAMKQRHVLFQEEDQDTYIREMLNVFPLS
jgi:hypothetical protein